MAISQEQKSFIERVGALAAADMKKSGVLASLTIAQAILESGWGKSGLTVKANALFGIKAGSSWSGKAYSASTQECYDGVSFTTITALFRAYDSWEESVADHSALLTGLARYAAVIGETDYKKACAAVHAAGYATDPQYTGKLVNLIETYGLTDYDAMKGEAQMKSTEFISKLQNIVDNYKTVYMWGVFGAPVTESVIAGKAKQYPSWYTAARQASFRSLIGKGYFAFDCVCLIKGVLWGWSGDASKSYGGAAYTSNGVPDIGADTMITKCTGVSTDFSNIVPGEAVWLSGHIGVYIGNGKVIECTPAWGNCVQVTACLNIGSISGLNGRKWTKHGKLPYITYDTAPAAGTPTTGGTFAVGDIVEFSGTTHYTSAAATSGKSCKAGTAKITATAPGKAHPYHLIAESGGGSTVYGWVDADKIKAITTTAPAEPAAKPTAAEITAANGVADGVITSPDYWIDVINGKKTASGANVKALIDKYHDALKGAKAQ